MNREQRYRQILDALFEIAEPGPTKASLWQAYQEANDEPDQLERIEQQIALLRETTDTAIKHLAGHVSHLAQQFNIDHKRESE